MKIATGIKRIENERLRQIFKKCYDKNHDQQHSENELLFAAIAYIFEYCIGEGEGSKYWPWEINSFKPRNNQRDLEKAGALIAAELDRLKGI